jgi:hypothetical protein
VKQIGLFKSLDVYLALNPVGALLGDAFLLELIGEFKTIVIDQEGFFLGLIRIEAVYKRRFAEEEVEVFNAFEFLLECIEGVNSEIGGDDGEI